MQWMVSRSMCRYISWSETKNKTSRVAMPFVYFQPQCKTWKQRSRSVNLFLRFNYYVFFNLIFESHHKILFFFAYIYLVNLIVLMTKIIMWLCWMLVKLLLIDVVFVQDNIVFLLDSFQWDKLVGHMVDYFIFVFVKFFRLF